jgi:hypothetical protein
VQIARDIIPKTRLFALEYSQAAPLRDAFEHVPNAAGLQDLKDLVLNESANTEAAASLLAWGWSAVAAFAFGAFCLLGRQAKQSGAGKIKWQCAKLCTYQRL